MSHHLSSSKVDLALYACSFWARPEVTIPVRPPRKSGFKGTRIHGACEAHHNGTPMPPLTVDETRNWLSLKRWLESEPPFTGMELPLLYDAESDTARLCELGDEKRDYLGVTAMTIPGTIDLYRFEEGSDLVTLLEVKTGAHANVEKEPDNQQLATQGLAAARYFGVERVRLGAIFTRLTKIRPPEWHEMGPDDLDLHAGKLRRLLRALPESAPTPGKHCWNCPIGLVKGFKSPCPAWQDEAAAE